MRKEAQCPEELGQLLLSQDAAGHPHKDIICERTARRQRSMCKFCAIHTAMRCHGSWSEISAGSAKRRLRPAGCQSNGMCQERGRRASVEERVSVAAGTTKDGGRRGRGREQGARRGVQQSKARARVEWGQRGPFSSDPAAPAARRPRGSRRSPWFGTQGLPTGDVVPAHPSLFLPSNTGRPLPSAVIAFALAVPPAWGAPPSALPSDTACPASPWPP